MSYYVDLPAPRVGRNALLDLAPVNNALEGVRDQNNANRNALLAQQQMDMRKEEQTYQRGRDAKQDARIDQKYFADGAQSVMNLPATDPRRAAVWQNLLKRHPNPASLTPDYLDPVKGPEMVLAEYGALADPRDSRLKDLKIQETEAQIGKLNREASGVGAKYGKTGAIVQGADGRYYSVQFAEDGTKKIDPLAVGETALTPSRGVDVVGDTMYDKATGRTVQNVGSALSGGEQAKAEGKNIAEGRANLPKQRVALDQYEESNKVVLDNIDLAVKQSDGWTTTGFVGTGAKFVPGTPAHDLSNTLNTIKSNLGFDKLQAMRDASPTGGALGQVSEMENRLLQSTWGSVEQSQSREQLVRNLGSIKAIRERFALLKKQAYEEDVQRFGASNVPNPDTGQLPQSGTPQPQGDVAAPKSAEEYGRLPSGMRYRDPEGNMRIKP